jgi:hypothetical protein
MPESGTGYFPSVGCLIEDRPIRPGQPTFAKALQKSSEIGKSLKLVNDACPEGTSNAVIGENPLLGGKPSTETIVEVEGTGIAFPRGRATRAPATGTRAK